MESWSQIQPDAFWRLVREGKLAPEQIIDVREQEEWDYYHLEGSTLMPLSSFQETWESHTSGQADIYHLRARRTKSCGMPLPKRKRIRQPRQRGRRDGCRIPS